MRYWIEELANSGSVQVEIISTDHGAGTLVYEISDLLDPKHYARVQGIEEAARSWDGTHPIREGAK